jgi:hypothetical protein
MSVFDDPSWHYDELRRDLWAEVYTTGNLDTDILPIFKQIIRLQARFIARRAGLIRLSSGV